MHGRGLEFDKNGKKVYEGSYLHDLRLDTAFLDSLSRQYNKIVLFRNGRGIEFDENGFVIYKGVYIKIDLKLLNKLFFKIKNR